MRVKNVEAFGEKNLRYLVGLAELRQRRTIELMRTVIQENISAATLNLLRELVDHAEIE